MHWAHDTTCMSASCQLYWMKGADGHGSLDYEQQRRDLLRKHGIDLEDGNQDGTKTKRIDRKDLEKIMGEGPGGVFTWREKNRKKVRMVRIS